jgi:hypothetical protein
MPYPPPVTPDTGSAPSIAIPSTDVSATVDSDHTCFQCSYNLRGLRADGVCSECGYSISDSLARAFIQYTSKPLLRRVRRGIQLMNGAMALCAPLALLAIGIFLSYSRSIAAVGLAELVGLICLAAFNLIAIGAWLYTSPHLSPAIHRQTRGTRTTIRACSLIPWTSTVMLVPLFFGAPIGTYALYVVLGSLFVLPFAWIVQISAVLRYAERLAQQIPDDDLRQRAVHGTWIVPMISIVGAPLVLIGPFVGVMFSIGILSRLSDHLKSIERTDLPEPLQASPSQRVTPNHDNARAVR